MSDKKLAVIFPGIGYHTDKPLLYYSKKIARQHGYDIVELSFHDIDKDALLAGGRPDALTQSDRKKMLEAFQTVTTEAEEQLRSTDFAGYKDIIFISKSIGTVAASVYAAREKVAARQVYFTPLEQTFSQTGLSRMPVRILSGRQWKESCSEQLPAFCVSQRSTAVEDNKNSRCDTFKQYA